MIHRQELKKLDFSEVTKDNRNILHIACINSDKDTINLILNINLRNDKLKINLKDNIKHWTPLFYVINSCDNGQPDIVDILIKNSSEINISDIKGITPLHLAAYRGQDDNLENLIKHKANINKRDSLGRVPLTYAIMEGQTNCVQALIEAGTDLKIKDINGNNFLHYAVGGKGNSLLYSNLLLNKGVEVNDSNNEGNTPIMILAKRNPQENVRLINKLINHGAKLDDIINNNGESFYSIMGEEALNTNFIKNKKIEDFKLNRKNSNNQFSIFLIITISILLISYLLK